MPSFLLEFLKKYSQTSPLNQGNRRWTVSRLKLHYNRVECDPFPPTHRLYRRFLRKPPECRPTMPASLNPSADQVHIIKRTLSIYIERPNAAWCPCRAAGGGRYNPDIGKHSLLFERARRRHQLRDLTPSPISGTNPRNSRRQRSLRNYRRMCDHPRRRGRRNIDLVLSDLGLPRLAGQDMLSHLLKINPGVRVIFASGFMDPETKSAIAVTGTREFIQKPYSAVEVLSRVREVLNK